MTSATRGPTFHREGGRDGGSAVLGILRGRIRGDGRDDRFGLPIRMGGEEGTGNLEGVEREVVAAAEIIKKAFYFRIVCNKKAGLRFLLHRMGNPFPACRFSASRSWHYPSIIKVFLFPPRRDR
jgi:hypothetical protein